MKNKIVITIFCCFLILVLSAGPISVFANETAQGMLDVILEQQEEGFLTKTAGVGGEWYVIGLRQYQQQDFSNYEEALLSYLQENTVYSATSRQKYALALLAAGSTNAYIQNTVNDSIGQQGIMSWVFGLHLLNNGCESETYTIEDVKDTILSLQLEDGGWAITGTIGDVDTTAMAIQALAPYYKTDTAVANAVDNALLLLSARQLEDGDYASYGVSNPESTAQVMIALSALGIDCTQDSRFIKNEKSLFDGIEKYQLTDGSFCHQIGGNSNQMATAQVFCAMVSYVRMINGKGGLYIFENEPTKETTPSIAPTQKAEQETKTENYKLWLCLAILLVGVVVSLILFFLKKPHIKNFIMVFLVVALGIGIVLLTDIQTAEDYYNSQPTEKPNSIGTVTLTIRCDTVSEENRVILDTTEFSIAQGDTVFTILTEAARKHDIHLEYSGTETMAYVKGIDHLYELQHGDLSGWVYHVNGKSHSLGCSEYVLQDGDAIAWYYSCDLGNDVK